MAIEVSSFLPLRANLFDLLAAETALAGLQPIALELIATPDGKHIALRGEAEAVAQAFVRIAAAYPGSERAAFVPPAPPRHAFELRLRGPAFLPLRTHFTREGRIVNDDLALNADPLLGVLTAMSESPALVQFALQPMPADWARYWRGSAGDIGERQQATPHGLAARMLLPLGLGLGALGLGVLLLAALVQGPALLFGLALGLLLVGVGMVALRVHTPSLPDPALVRHKASQSAFRVRIRCWASSPEQAVRMQSAFSAYNLAGGNGFVFRALPPDEDPNDLRVDAPGEPFVGFVRPPQSQLPILSVSELSALWHLPHAAAAVQGLRYASGKRVAPPPGTLAAADGVEIADGLRLPERALRGNIGLIARTQSGKSNLMALLTAHILRSDPQATVIVLDPHRTLAQQVARLVPPARESETIYWDLSDRVRPFGWNLLECAAVAGGHRPAAHDMPIDKRVSDIIDAFREVWIENWGPRMEDYLRGPLLTLLSANTALARQRAYEDWLLGARVELQSLANAINSGQLDDDAIAQIAALVERFQALQPPSHPGHIDPYHRLATFIAQAFSTSTTSSTFLQACRALHRKVCFESAPVPMPESELPSLYQRTYGARGEPMQFNVLDVNPMLMGGPLRQVALSGLNSESARYIHAWWRDAYDAYLKLNARLLMDMITPVTKKLNRFAASDVARRIFGQPASTLDLTGVLREPGVLLVDLAAGVIGQETASLIGSLLLNWIASLAFANAGGQGGDGRAPRRRIWLVVDEFQSFPGADFAFMLSELAKHGVQLVMGTQSLKLIEQASPKTRAAWLANTSTLFVFRCSAEDAEVLAGELGVSAPDPLSVTPEDIVGLPDFACYVRVPDDRRAPQVFRADTRKVDDGDDAMRAGIVAASRETYGRDAAEVDAWLARASELQGEPTLGQGNGPTFGAPPVVPPAQGGIDAPARDRDSQIAAVRAAREAERRTR